jgi:DNA-binding CsgD family transcriptional regulator
MDITPKKIEWNISEKQLALFSIKDIEEVIRVFNCALGRERFYAVDYFRQKIIVGSPKSIILCGYPKGTIEQEGFGFYDRILKPKECDWIMRMNKASYEVFYNYPVSERKNLAVFYDLTIQTSNNKQFILFHKVVPYRLCNSGNAWLGLCYVEISTSKVMGNKAFFINSKTYEKYDFINDKFILSKKPIVNEQEKQVLECISKGLTDKEMTTIYGEETSLGAFKKKKRNMFSKLEVTTNGAAVHKAHLLGII